MDRFPVFFEAIQQNIQQSHTVDNHNGTYGETDGLAFPPFDVFGFIDCSIDRISKPFSGPVDDSVGAGQKEEYSIAQRAFYTGYKKIHGIKVEKVLSPNGIKTIFGPLSATSLKTSKNFVGEFHEGE